MAKMTASLLQSYDYYLKVPTAQSLLKLKNTLTQEFTGSVATVRGERYEDYVDKKLLLNQNFDRDFEQEAFACLRGSTQQDWLKPLNIVTKYGTFTYKGRLDFLQPDCIYDLKTTKHFKADDYHIKWQHSIYALAMNKKRFVYIIAVFNDEQGLVPTSIETVEPTIATLDDLTKHTEACVKFMLDNFDEEFRKWSKMSVSEAINQNNEAIGQNNEVIF